MVRETGETGVEEAVLEGHLGIARELLNFLPPDKKYQLGSDEKTGVNLIKVCVKLKLPGVPTTHMFPNEV
jgi:ubiquitin carboxyl-terminal hydrolase 9/24